MLSDEQIRQYHEDGYVIPDLRLSAEDLADIRAATTGCWPSIPEFVDYCPAVLAFDTSFLNIARKPAILDLVEQLIGPDFALWNSSFFAKPARRGQQDAGGIRMASIGRSGPWLPARRGSPWMRRRPRTAACA